ncbi:MAG: hypothetical protein AAFX06_30240 [Planctomycetota bacterium]
MLAELLRYPTVSAVLAACVTALLGMGAFFLQTQYKILLDKRERRRLLYETLIEQVFRLLDAKPGRESSQVMTEIEKSWLFASDGVLKACYSIFEVYEAAANESDAGASLKLRESAQSREQFAAAVSDLFIALRAESYGLSRIDQEWALKHVKIYEWGALHNGDE